MPNKAGSATSFDYQAVDGSHWSASLRGLRNLGPLGVNNPYFSMWSSSILAGS